MNMLLLFKHNGGNAFRRDKEFGESIPMKYDRCHAVITSSKCHAPGVSNIHGCFDGNFFSGSVRIKKTYKILSIFPLNGSYHGVPFDA